MVILGTARYRSDPGISRRCSGGRDASLTSQDSFPGKAAAGRSDSRPGRSARAPRPVPHASFPPPDEAGAAEFGHVFVANSNLHAQSNVIATSFGGDELTAALLLRQELGARPRAATRLLRWMTRNSAAPDRRTLAMPKYPRWPAAALSPAVLPPVEQTSRADGVTGVGRDPTARSLRRRVALCGGRSHQSSRSLPQRRRCGACDRIGDEAITRAGDVGRVVCHARARGGCVLLAGLSDHQHRRVRCGAQARPSRQRDDFQVVEGRRPAYASTPTALMTRCAQSSPRGIKDLSSRSSPMSLRSRRSP